MPGSGAYVVPIDQPAGTARRAVVPLPPTNNAGIVDFNPVFLSLANSLTVPVTVAITALRQPGGASTSSFTVPAQTRVSVPNFIPTAPGDLAVGILTTAPATVPPGVLTALVEYGTP